MFSPKFTINNAVTSALTQIERVRGFLEAATLSEHLTDQILRTERKLKTVRCDKL